MVTEARFELAITCTPSMYHFGVPTFWITSECFTKLDYPVLINSVHFCFILSFSIIFILQISSVSFLYIKTQSVFEIIYLEMNYHKCWRNNWNNYWCFIFYNNLNFYLLLLLSTLSNESSH